jgi:hypothetical protein
MPTRKRPVSSLVLRERREALRRSNGKCQCTADLHNWHQTGFVCDRPVGERPHFYGTLSSGYKVICTKCHTAILSLNY